MLQKFYQQSEVNKCLKPQPTTLKKDVTLKNGYRATFDYDPVLKTFPIQPSAVIKKTRIDDINLKSGRKTQIDSVLSTIQTLIPSYMSTDIRISVSTEEVFPLVLADTKGITERVKERTSFKFGWMQLDFTKVT